MLTAVGQATGFRFSMEKDGYWMKADDFADKPLPPDQLVERIRRLVAQPSEAGKRRRHPRTEPRGRRILRGLRNPITGSHEETEGDPTSRRYPERDRGSAGPLAEIRLWKLSCPEIARAVAPGQFVVFRADDYAERIPLTVADFDREAGLITVIFQAVGSLDPEARDVRRRRRHHGRRRPPREEERDRAVRHGRLRSEAGSASRRSIPSRGRSRRPATSSSRSSAPARRTSSSSRTR